MNWSSVISSDDVVAIHAVLIPTANGDGEILLVGGDDHDRAANVAGRFDHSRRFNCRHPDSALIYVQSPNVDLFCCGHCYLGDGRVVFAGGTTTFPPQSEGIHSHIHFEGHRQAFLYEVASGHFTEIASMGLEPGTRGGGGRWYPTLCTLSTGEVLVMAGHPAGDDTRHNNNRPERYQPLANRWVMLPAIGPDDPPSPDVLPRMHVLRNGQVFVSSALQGNSRCIAIDAWKGTKHEVCDLPDGAYRGYGCPSVLLPLTPADGYRPRILLCGGVTSQVIDLGAANPPWTTVPRSGATAGRARNNACATILPTGDVLMTGGADPANDQSGIMQPELYSTPTNHAHGIPSYVAGSGSWVTINEPATVLRNYHSSAILMPDGRVWTAGGNSPTQPDTPPSVNQKKIEIFAPPYPPGARPVINSCPAAVEFGQGFVVETNQAQQIRHVTLLRCGSSTHAYNPDQRCILLSFDVEAPNRLHVTAPPHGAIAPPGSYMLFLIDDGGRPCQYARFVHVGRISLPLLSEHSADLDGDRHAEVFVTSPWGIGVFKLAGGTLNTPMMAPNGTRFGGWLLNTADNAFGPIADYDGDGRAEILVSSPWGIGLLKLSGSTLSAPMMAPNGTRFGGWLLNTADNHFQLAGDFDGDGHAEILVTSPWGIGILKSAGSALNAPMMAPNGSRFGGWLLNTADNVFGPVADYDGDGRAEILVTSPWGIGILKLSGGALTAPMMAPNGTRFGGWLLNTNDNHFGPAADYDGDGHAEILVTSPWGIGVLKLAGSTLNAPMMAPNGTRFGGWLLNTADNLFGLAADYQGARHAPFVVTSPWGMGILSLTGNTLTPLTMSPNGTRFGGWLLNSNDNQF